MVRREQCIHRNAENCGAYNLMSSVLLLGNCGMPAVLDCGIVRSKRLRSDT
jgi:hypothetical protein